MLTRSFERGVQSFPDLEISACRDETEQPLMLLLLLGKCNYSYVCTSKSLPDPPKTVENPSLLLLPDLAITMAAVKSPFSPVLPSSFSVL